MRPRDAALVACRTLAVILASVFVIAFMALAVGGALSAGQVWAVLITIVFVTVVLWSGADGLADRMAAGASEPVGPAPSPTRFQAVAIAVVGLIQLATGIPGMVAAIATQTSFGSIGVSFTGPQIARYVTQLVVGLALLLGAGGISRWIESRESPPELPPTIPPPAVPPPI